jgi:poly-beta-hydroxyalkanoate depolymerase
LSHVVRAAVGERDEWSKAPPVPGQTWGRSHAVRLGAGGRRYRRCALHALPAPATALPALRQLRAACEFVSRARPTHYCPDWGIDAVPVGDQTAKVVQQPVTSTPFGTLLHFAKPTVAQQPRVLLVGADVRALHHAAATDRPNPADRP